MAAQEHQPKKLLSSSSISREEKFKIIEEAYTKAKSRPRKPLIRKVPFALRSHKNFDKYFEPRAVALGPIHHKRGLELPEEYKLRLAEEFIRDGKQQFLFPVEMTEQTEEQKLTWYKEFVYKKVEDHVGELRKCYKDDVTESYNDSELAWMLFLDGTSLLSFIKCVAEKKLKDMNMKNDLAAFGQQDVFLLENQLPYKLLELLMSSSGSTEHENSIKGWIDKFIDENITEVKSPSSDGSMIKGPSNGGETDLPECPHLLHLLRKKLLSIESGDINGKDNDQLGNSSSSKHGKPEQCPSVNKGNPIAGPPSSTAIDVESAIQKKKQAQSPPPPPPNTFRNIQELKGAGIQVKPGSEIRFVGGRKFFTSATLYLPRMVVDDWTGPKLLNLVAYETCPDFFNEFGITSYVCFLDSLIDKPEDVKDLRDAGILYNILGSDEEVATLFNEISTDLVPNGQTYLETRKKIHDHYNTRWKTWIAQAYHDHFSSPWTMLAFIGAVVGLTLSAIQAWLAMFADDDPCKNICRALPSPPPRRP